MAYVWSAWRRIRRRKAPGFNGHNPIEWPDIDAFIRRTGTALDPFDIDLIEALDDLFLAKMAEQAGEHDREAALKDGLKSIEKR
ncbi:hypothetical protein ACFOOL_06875 [Devosia honganensis]|uniref:DUF1048 domain-containing protein n=1 Tax=Devosia honganensis TaxID=1610527 RepID=A0ABV7X001_9HYPH